MKYDHVCFIASAGYSRGRRYDNYDSIWLEHIYVTVAGRDGLRCDNSIDRQDLQVLH